MSKTMIALCVTAALGLAGPAAAQSYPVKTAAAPMSKDGYVTAKKDADAQYKVDHDACSSLSGNAKDICVADAKGREQTCSIARSSIRQLARCRISA